MIPGMTQDQVEQLRNQQLVAPALVPQPTAPLDPAAVDPAPVQAPPPGPGSELPVEAMMPQDLPPPVLPNQRIEPSAAPVQDAVPMPPDKAPVSATLAPLADTQADSVAAYDQAGVARLAADKERADAMVGQLAAQEQALADYQERYQAAMAAAQERVDARMATFDKFYQELQDDKEGNNKTWWESANTPQKIGLVLGTILHVGTALAGQPIDLVSDIVRRDAERKWRNFQVKQFGINAALEGVKQQQKANAEQQLYLSGQQAISMGLIDSRINQIKENITDKDQTARLAEFQAKVQGLQTQYKTQYYNLTATMENAQAQRDIGRAQLALGQQRYEENRDINAQRLQIQKDEAAAKRDEKAAQLDSRLFTVKTKEQLAQIRDYTLRSRNAYDATQATIDALIDPGTREPFTGLGGLYHLKVGKKGDKYRQALNNLIVQVKEQKNMGAAFSNMEKGLVDAMLTGNPGVALEYISKMDGKRLQQNLQQFQTNLMKEYVNYAQANEIGLNVDVEDIFAPPQQAAASGEI